MNVDQILALAKDRIGIRSDVRDSYIRAIIESVIQELEREKGITLFPDSMLHTMFIVDYVTWRYLNRDSSEGMPRHLQFRLHNLMLSVEESDSDDI